MKFTLDLPPTKWRDRKAFIFFFKILHLIFHQQNGGTGFENSKLGFYKSPNIKSTRRRYTPQFSSGLTGILRDWWQSLGEYRQLRFLQRDTSIEDALTYFYGQETLIIERLQLEFFKMKCSSIKKKKLEKCFKHMTKRFYLIRRIDDPNLKQAFLSSITKPLEKRLSDFSHLAERLSKIQRWENYSNLY